MNVPWGLLRGYLGDVGEAHCLSAGCLAVRWQFGKWFLGGPQFRLWHRVAESCGFSRVEELVPVAEQGPVKSLATAWASPWSNFLAQVAMDSAKVRSTSARVVMRSFSFAIIFRVSASRCRVSGVSRDSSSTTIAGGLCRAVASGCSWQKWAGYHRGGASHELFLCIMVEAVGKLSAAPCAGRRTIWWLTLKKWTRHTFVAPIPLYITTPPSPNTLGSTVRETFSEYSSCLPGPQPHA